jgi:hypothetical protein
VQALEITENIDDALPRSCVMSLAWKFQQTGFMLYNLNTGAGYK